jgi:hypothetical protein
MGRSYRTFRVILVAGVLVAVSCSAAVFLRAIKLGFANIFAIDMATVQLLALAATATAVANWAGCRAVRPRRRICEYCGYDLRMIDSRKCPECGNPAPLVGQPRNPQERVVAALRGRKLQDLEPPDPHD